jgi:hypothetical protein
MALLHMGILFLTMPYSLTSFASAQNCSNRGGQVCAYQEAKLEDNVNPMDEAKAMLAKIKEMSLALRQILGSLQLLPISSLVIMF